ncbi:hypothetical protein P9X10_01175 [Bacillus cereus]|nr:hypothetical protein [Bacillus cereus]
MGLVACMTYTSVPDSKCNIRVWTGKGKRINRLTDIDKFIDWCKLLKITLTETERDEEDDIRSRHYVSDCILEDSHYWDLDEVPKEAIKCKGVLENEIVDIYISFRGLTTIIHYPNTLSPIWHQVKHDVDVEEFKKQNGYLIRDK